MDLSIISRTGGPALFWRGPDYDSLDLTGPVVANWVNKGVGLFGDYDLGPDFTLYVPMPGGLHWRELVAILAVLLGGGRVCLPDGGQPAAGVPDGGQPAAGVPDGEFCAFVPLGHEDDPSLVDAEEIFVFSPPALALSTPVDEEFIDVNSSIRAHPDVATRRLAASGILDIGGRTIDWTAGGSSTSPATSVSTAARPQGILVAQGTPLAAEWAEFLGHLLGGGEVVLANGVDDARIADLATSLGEVRGRLGTWTK